MTTILEIVLILLKIVYQVMMLYIKWSVEERRRFEERIKIVKDVLEETIKNREEVLDENDYLSNLEWEQKERYSFYKTASLNILNAGGGITELKAVETMGMHLRVQASSDKIVAILVLDILVDEKAALIAKTLVETVTEG